MDAKKFFPQKLQQDELFNKFLSDFQGYTSPFENTFIDIIGKYSGSEELPIESINEIFNEFGLRSLTDLLAVSPIVDRASLLNYASAINVLKGSETGYFLVLSLLNFDFDAVVWHEQSPKGKPNTFALDVKISSSQTPNPYETFQRIKRFTRDYLLPLIDPLAYTLVVGFSELAVLHHSYAQNIRFLNTEELLIDDSLLFSRTRFIVLDELDQKWNIKVNNFGQLQAFKTDVGDVVPSFSLVADDLSVKVIKVNSSGTIFTEDADETVSPIAPEFTLVGRDESLWFFRIDAEGNVFVELFNEEL
jgi:hypothetical protein